VYRIQCLNKEIKDFYIGSTKDLEERIGKHKSNCNNSNSPQHNYKVYTCIRENGGWDNWKFDIELLATGYDKETRLEWEQNYIECLKPSLNSINAKTDRKEYMNEWHTNNKEQEKQYRENNKEKINDYSKQYHLANKQKEKQYRLDNKEKINDYAKQYYLDNKEKINEKRRNKSLAKKEKIKVI